jgi:uncharacterized membrane protein
MRLIAPISVAHFVLSFLAGTTLGPNRFASAFIIQSSHRTSKWLSSQQSDKRWKERARLTVLSAADISQHDAELALWVAAFASSHIGMSAVRSDIIQKLGNLASPLVDQEGWELPSWWPGDAVGKSQVFPTNEIAGRQLYRIGYTILSFWTLGSALLAYLHAAGAVGQEPILQAQVVTNNDEYTFYLCTAALSFGASIASLFNASPLGLMPGFEGATGPELSVQRNDALKFTVRGLTRITRHPLILPVVPWGIATSYLAGGRLCDYILFSGLAAYAVAGCAAQDLRVSKKEGSVGTVFQPSDEEGEQLAEFFDETSCIPFAAVLDGRQSIASIFREVPWFAFFVGTGMGFYLEEIILRLLRHE